MIVAFEGFSGRYVWHCHILEDEDNERTMKGRALTRVMAAP
jgi:FtsP/CotA-like multicopper oxidase with cupredoxin domain